MMHVLLFGLHVCKLREGYGARVTAMLVWVMAEVWLLHVIDECGTWDERSWGCV